MHGDGDGWVFDAAGNRYWGRHGAAGLLLTADTADGRVILLQHRAFWSHQGGTWALPGGARDSHETAAATAVREAGEEAGIRDEHLTVCDEVVTHSTEVGWTYTTVIARADEPVATRANGESAELRWVPEGLVDDLRLHPAFAAAWPSLRERLAEL